ncbi:DMSO/selenate family reductase complex A subunit [Endozoicomonas ascidiicola]|uniref:DMSO/selenate family reductase complex A subunit n=1 Tax=Endozoicomonas ascidiicola TaxID=1698521 RepID=UPI00082FFB28|nr:DMSO/selenate family reductase complex A subunit [Endozoicomonas ascidiicola]
MTLSNSEKISGLHRRDFLKASVAVGSAAAVSSMSIPLVQASQSDQSQSKESIHYSACLVNCGSRCPLKVHVTDGVITKISTEDGIDDKVFGKHKIKPCLRGRSVRWRTYNPDRIKYPMKRVGKRGEGKFERISWDEATTIIAKELRRVIDTYGNEAIYYQYGSGSTGANFQGRNACKRLLNTCGGFLEQHNSYSTAQIGRVEPFVYGSGQGTLISSIKDSDLVVMFGQNLAETRMSGGGQIAEIYEALSLSQAKVIIIDPRKTDSTIGFNAEWLPIRPGTDSALVAAIANTLVKESLADDAFINQYAVGWDESTLPASAPENSSYKQYVLGKGPDGIEKTPEWASKITNIPASRIRQLARELITAKAAWIAQGWGLQRTSHGEQAAQSIMLLPVLTGQFGKPGTNTGNWGKNIAYPVPGFAIPNPVKTSIPCFLWTDAITRGTEMTATNAYVKGKERLETNVKFLWHYASNVTMNQHSDLNKTAEILKDESLCEFIMVWDNQMTASARYADIVLPDVTQVETRDLVNNSYASGAYHYCLHLDNAIKPLWDNRPTYEVLTDIAEKMGVKEAFTEGRTYEQWIAHGYQQMRAKNPSLPSYEELNGIGVVDRKLADPDQHIALKDFRHDPEAYPLKTPSGKIEIYSEQLAKLGAEWELNEGDKITAIPEYHEAFESIGDKERLQDYPLQMTGFHTKGRTHSTYHSIAQLREIVPDEVWINPVDADARNLKQGDKAEIFNDRGRLHMRVKITSRIMPGVIAVPQGAWHQTNRQGIDVGGCINTLTTMRPSPLAKGNPQHTNLVDIKRA